MIIETGGRRIPKLVIFLALLSPLIWRYATCFWDQYEPYTGKVVAKQIQYSLLSGRNNGGDLYITMEDSQGRQSKKFVGTELMEGRDWLKIKVGSSVVKEKGLGYVPHEIGTTPIPERQPLPATHGLVWALILVCACTMVYRLRDLYRSL